MENVFNPHWATLTTLTSSLWGLILSCQFVSAKDLKWVSMLTLEYFRAMRVLAMGNLSKAIV